MIELRIHNEQKLDTAHPKLLHAIGVLIATLHHHAETSLDITWITGGKHMRGSRHYTGQAVDLLYQRWRNPSLIVPDLRARLGDNYDVVPETDHLHIEYDPD